MAQASLPSVRSAASNRIGTVDITSTPRSVDMQNLFAVGFLWHTAWIKRVLSVVERVRHAGPPMRPSYGAIITSVEI